MNGVSKSLTYVGGSGNDGVDGSGDRLWDEHGRRARVNGCGRTNDTNGRAAHR